MWNQPTKKDMNKLPKLYETEQISVQNKIIHFHFFIGGCDWYIAEYDGEDLFWGFAILNGDYHNAEWGYISLNELMAINIHGIEVDRDLHWRIRPAIEVDKIRNCWCHHHWNG